VPASCSATREMTSSRHVIDSIRLCGDKWSPTTHALSHGRAAAMSIVGRSAGGGSPMSPSSDKWRTCCCRSRDSYRHRSTCARSVGQRRRPTASEMYVALSGGARLPLNLISWSRRDGKSVFLSVPLRPLRSRSSPPGCRPPRRCRISR